MAKKVVSAAEPWLQTLYSLRTRIATGAVSILAIWLFAHVMFGSNGMVVYRAKFAPTIWAARQLVSHGHIRVNGVKCNIASRRVDIGDVVELGAKAQEMALVIEAQGLAERDVPDYVVPDGNTKVTYTRVPKLDEVPYPVRMGPNLVIEFYSR